MSFNSTTNSDKNVFKTIFENHWSEFKLRNPSYDRAQYDDVVKKMLGCGEASSGYSEYTCMNCGYSHQVCFSCKSGFCLSCSVGYVEGVMDQVSSVLHAGVVYRHIILTLPDQLLPYFFKNRHEGAVLSSFMKLGYEFLEYCVSFLRKKLLKIGCIVVIHTHGRLGNYRPHLHIIMTDGGIDLQRKQWVVLGYCDYEVLRKKWKKYLLDWSEATFDSSIKPLIDELWNGYQNGFVFHLSQGKVPESGRGLARYLAKYVASPPIAIKRIISYDSQKQEVKYWYRSHQTKQKEIEKVDVFTFIGRMVQHVFVKGFQRIRYYGLQATKTFKKWKSIILEGIKGLKRMAKGTYQIVAPKSYRVRYYQISKRDPLTCPSCQVEMELSRIWHPKYGVIYELMETLPIVREVNGGSKQRDGVFLRGGCETIQLSLC